MVAFGPCVVRAKGCKGECASENSEHSSWNWRKAKRAGALTSNDKDYGGVETSWTASTYNTPMYVCGSGACKRLSGHETIHKQPRTKAERDAIEAAATLAAAFASPAALQSAPVSSSPTVPLTKTPSPAIACSPPVPPLSALPLPAPPLPPPSLPVPPLPTSPLQRAAAQQPPPTKPSQPDQPLLQMSLRKRPEREAEVEAARAAKAQAPVIKPLLYSEMARANATILGEDPRWLKSGACALKDLSQPAAELYKFLKDPSNWTSTGQLIIGCRTAGGYSNWEDTNAAIFDANEQKAHTVAFTRALRSAARKISPLAEILDRTAKQVAEIHGAELEWLVGHVLDQTSPLAQFRPHQDTNEMYSSSGQHVCDTLYTVLIQLDPCGQSAMEVIGCDQAATYSGCGSGFVFRSDVWHRTMYAQPGVWKLALFYGKYL